MKKLVSHVLFWNLDKSLLIWIIGSEMNWLFLYIKHILEWQQWQKDAFWATWDHYWVCLIVVNPLAQFSVAVITKCVICEIGVVLSVVLCISYSWNWKVKAGDFKTLTLHWYFLVAIFIMSQSWPTLQSSLLLYLVFCISQIQQQLTIQLGASWCIDVGPPPSPSRGRGPTCPEAPQPITPILHFHTYL